MSAVVSALTQSQFYSPAFNAAIFDGPVRIYFAQYQEALALKLYFRIQEKLKLLYDDLPSSTKYSSQYVFLMLYPNEETFSHAFPNTVEKIGVGPLGEDVVYGVSAPLADDEIGKLAQKIEGLIQSWETVPYLQPLEV